MSWHKYGISCPVVLYGVSDIGANFFAVKSLISENRGIYDIKLKILAVSTSLATRIEITKEKNP